MMCHFKCQICGACCRIKDGIVRVNADEISRIARYLQISEDEFIKDHTDLSPDRQGLILRSRPNGECVYLNSENLCTINEVKPDKCRTFPFEWVNPDSASVCPGLFLI
jgi:Fe-S-cluster containining protein